MFKIILNTVKNMGILNKLVGNTGEYYVEKTLKKNGFHVKPSKRKQKTLNVTYITYKINKKKDKLVKTWYYS